MPGGPGPTDMRRVERVGATCEQVGGHIDVERQTGLDMAVALDIDRVLKESQACLVDFIDRYATV